MVNEFSLLKDDKEKGKIIVGRNANENHEIIQKYSSFHQEMKDKNVLWFHVHDKPSPHVLLIFPKNEIPSDDDIILASKKCKEYSKFKDYPSITIEYTPLKNIMIVPNTPGMVFVKPFTHTKKIRV